MVRKQASQNFKFFKILNFCITFSEYITGKQTPLRAF